jgi:hypothetical protein
LLLLFSIAVACREEWRDIPSVYRGSWSALDDASIWRRMTIGSDEIKVIDEDGRTHTCRAKTIASYRHGGLFGLTGDPAIRVECVVSNPQQIGGVNIVQTIGGHVLQVEIDDGVVLFERE